MLPPLRATGPLDGPQADRRFRAYGLARDRLGLLYARRFPVDQLRLMVAFFEGPAGSNLREGPREITQEMLSVLDSEVFRADLRESLCAEDQRRSPGARTDPPPGLGCPPRKTLEQRYIELMSLGRRLALAGTFDGILQEVGAAEIDRIAADAPGLDRRQRQRLREIGARRLAAERERLAASVGEVFRRNIQGDQLPAIVEFFEGAGGRAYRSRFPMLVPDIAATLELLGRGETTPGSIARLARWARENRSEIIIPGTWKGAHEYSRRLAGASDFTAVIGAFSPDTMQGVRRTQAIESLTHHFRRAFEWQDVPVRRELPEDTNAEPALIIFAEFFESPAGRAYTAAIPKMLPQIWALVHAANLAPAMRADFCRETGRLCGR